MHGYRSMCHNLQTSLPWTPYKLFSKLLPQYHIFHYELRCPRLELHALYHGDCPSRIRYPHSFHRRRPLRGRLKLSSSAVIQGSSDVHRYALTVHDPAVFQNRIPINDVINEGMAFAKEDMISNTNIYGALYIALH
jgi:hypothetical protein